jgi:hypothetical protein
LPAARNKATLLGVLNNLRTFGATVSPYMPSVMVGPAVVPSYVGWYFTVIRLGHALLPVYCAYRKVTKERRFSQVWASGQYADFRSAARSLPEKNDGLKTFECDDCQLRPRNFALHNFLHPWSRIPAGPDVQSFTSTDFLRKMRGQHNAPPS